MLLYYLIIIIIVYIFFFDLRDIYYLKLKNLNLKICSQKMAKKQIFISLFLVFLFIIIIRFIYSCDLINQYYFNIILFFLIYSIIALTIKITLIRFYYYYFDTVNKMIYKNDLETISRLASYRKFLFLIHYILFFILFLNVFFKFFILTLLFLLIKFIINLLINIININLNKDFNDMLHQSYYNEIIFFKGSGVEKLNIFKLFILTKFSNFNFLDRKDFYLVEILNKNMPGHNYVVLIYFEDYQIK